MKTSRLEAFSDGVLAIIITIMVLELKVPHATDLAILKPLLPVLLSYVLSFIYVGIYWNNHHHLGRRKPSRGHAHRRLRLRPPHGRPRLLHFAIHHHQKTRPQLPPRRRHRQRLERQTLAPLLPPRHP